MKATRQEVFWSHVNKDGPVVRPELGPCWEWTNRCVHHNGYGFFWFRGRMHMAHRVVFWLAGLEPPTWPMVVDHICKNKKCVRMDHLRAVSQADNTTIYADRSKMGERLSAKLRALPRIACGCGRLIGATGIGQHRKVCALAASAP